MFKMKNIEEENLPEKVIICEGQTDEIVLQAIAQKTESKGYNCSCQRKI